MIDRTPDNASPFRRRRQRLFGLFRRRTAIHRRVHGFRQSAILMGALVLTLVGGAQPVLAGAGNLAYRGLSSQPPTGYLPSPQFYDLSSGPATLNFSFKVTNPSPNTVSLPLDLDLSHIVTYNFHDVSTGQPGVPANSVLVTDQNMVTALAIQVPVASKPFPLTIAPNSTQTFTASMTLSTCGFFQFDIRSPLDGNGRGLDAGVIRVLGCMGTPAVSTTAVPSTALVGTLIHDTATVSGGNQPTGTVSFALHAPGDTQCFGPDLVAGLPGFKNLPFTAGQALTSASAPTTHVGTYRWVATYSGDASNRFVSSGCNAELVTIGRSAAAISTTASPVDGKLGTAIHDTAAVAGGYGTLTGSVSFALFGPADSTCAGNDLVATLSGFKNVPLSGTKADSAAFTPTLAGTYQWVATYSGNLFNNPSSSACGSEPVTIAGTTLAVPTIATTPSGPGPVGTSISDLAKVSGGSAPTGTVSFALYGPGDGTCAGPDLVQGLTGFKNVPLSGGSSVSNQFATTMVGTYRWVATYSGDAHNQSVTSGCVEEPVTTVKATAGFTSVPSEGGVLGISVNDEALVSGGYHPTGTVSFSLYGPGDPSCAGPDLLAGLPGFHAVPLVGGTATSPQFTPGLVGTYDWLATYSGDANNVPATHACGLEIVVITPPPGTPGISTAPSAGGPVATVVSDTATLSGGASPSGTVSFSLYGPGDTTCTGPDLTAGLAGFKNVPLALGKAASGGYTTNSVGTFRWVATYSGDAHNHAVGSPCGAETVVISQARPEIATLASPSSGLVGIRIHDTATLSSGVNPSGTVSFSLYGPGDATCSGTDLLAGNTSFKNIPLSNHQAVSAEFSTTQVGTYNWVAAYSGDANNAAQSSICGSEPVTTGSVLGAVSSAAPAQTGDLSMTLLLLGLLLLPMGMVLVVVGMGLRRRHA